MYKQRGFAMKFAAQHLTATFIGLAALACAAPVSAGTIFDTGQPGGPGGYSVYNNGSSDFSHLAAQFTVSQTTTLTSVQGWFGTTPVGRDKLVVSLHADAPAGLGAVLASETIKVPDYLTGPQNGSWVGAFENGAVTIGPGNYWASFTIDANDPNNCLCWMPANAPTNIAFGAYSNNFTGGNWRERELYFGFRVLGDAAGAVPEPASWALMIAGFGLIGGAMRVRTRKLSFA
jgi:PEP-CTERM motif